MKNDAVIRAEGLGKKYLIGHEVERERYVALRDVMAGAAKKSLRKASGLLGRRAGAVRHSVEEFWALKGVDFELQRGQVLGIIGRNGAGKSTLLKILSRITEPSAGRVEIKGRVASLLEVGTGFHPELTGRENIFLNGAILGMHRTEIKKKFDEIVAFAEVERFLDTPVKRYSSGMYVRLAFAVAAHLEPEILVVDEVLAVGDAEFQKKCLGKMSEVAGGEGRTVLFVSHSMAAILNLCTCAILLDRGRILTQGSANDVVSAYMSGLSSQPSHLLSTRSDRKGSAMIRFREVRLRSGADVVHGVLVCGQSAVFELHFDNNAGRDLRNLCVAIGINDQFGHRLFTLDTGISSVNFKSVPRNASRVDICIPELPLGPGRYGFTLYSDENGELADWIKDAGHFDVEGGDFYGSGKLPSADLGLFMVHHSFSVI
jgi:lipopolysaccharide transport system ATP-binding protein